MPNYSETILDWACLAFTGQSVPHIHVPVAASFIGGYEEYFFLPRPDFPIHLRVHNRGCAVSNSGCTASRSSGDPESERDPSRHARRRLHSVRGSKARAHGG